MKYHLYGKFDPFFNIMSKIFISCSIDANHYDFFLIVTNISGQNYGVTINSLLVTDFRLLPARNRSPFKYHCDHLDASLSVKIT